MTNVAAAQPPKLSRADIPIHGIGADEFPIGLPKSFDPIESWTRRLYRRTPKEIVKQIIEHDPDLARLAKAIRQQGEDSYDGVLVSMWADPSVRMDVLRRGNPKMPPALELRILDAYLERQPDLNLTLHDLRAVLPDWWVLVDMQASHLRHEFSKRLVALAPAFGALARWDSVDEEERDWAAAVVFAAGSLLSTRLVLDAAIRVQPALRSHFDGLAWHAQVPIGVGYLPPKIDYLAERASYDCPRVWELLNRASYFSVDHHRERFTPYDVCEVIEQVDALHRLSDPESLREDIGKILAASRDKFLASYKSYGASELDRLGIPVPFDFCALANRIIEFATPVRDIRYSLSMLKRLQSLAVGIRQVMRDAREPVRLIDTKLTELQSIVAEGAASQIEKVSALSSDITALKHVVADMLLILLPLKEIPSPAAAAPVLKPPKEVSPDAPAPDGDEAMLLENQALAGEIRRLRDVEQRLGEDVHNLNIQLAQARQTIGVRDQSSNTARRVADLAVEVGPLRPADMLRLIALLYGDGRVVVLPSAYKAAEGSSNFQFGERLYKILTLLVTEYRDALVAGRPDAEARHILGGAYRANESEITSSTHKYARLRVFQYEGREVEMFQHLAIGVENSEERTIRCHFYWDVSKKRMVIGYLGPHLATRNSP